MKITNVKIKDASPEIGEYLKEEIKDYIKDKLSENFGSVSNGRIRYSQDTPQGGSYCMMTFEITDEIPPIKAKLPSTVNISIAFSNKENTYTVTSGTSVGAFATKNGSDIYDVIDANIATLKNDHKKFIDNIILQAESDKANDRVNDSKHVKDDTKDPEVKKAFDIVYNFVKEICDRDNDANCGKGVECVGNVYGNTNQNCFMVNYKGAITHDPDYERKQNDFEHKENARYNEWVSRGMKGGYIGPTIKHNTDDYKYGFDLVAQCCKKDGGKYWVQFIPGVFLHVDKGDVQKAGQTTEKEYGSMKEVVNAMTSFFKSKDIFQLLSKVAGFDISINDSKKIKDADGTVEEVARRAQKWFDTFANGFIVSVTSDNKIIVSRNDNEQRKLNDYVKRYCDNNGLKYSDGMHFNTKYGKISMVIIPELVQPVKLSVNQTRPVKTNENNLVMVDSKKKVHDSGESMEDVVRQVLEEHVGVLGEVKQTINNDDYVQFEMSFNDDKDERWSGTIDVSWDDNYVPANDPEKTYKGLGWEYDLTRLSDNFKLTGHGEVEDYTDINGNDKDLGDALYEGMNEIMKKYDNLMNGKSVHDSVGEYYGGSAEEYAGVLKSCLTKDLKMVEVKKDPDIDVGLAFTFSGKTLNGDLINGSARIVSPYELNHANWRWVVSLYNGDKKIASKSGMESKDFCNKSKKCVNAIIKNDIAKVIKAVAFNYDLREKSVDDSKKKIKDSDEYEIATKNVIDDAGNNKWYYGKLKNGNCYFLNNQSDYYAIYKPNNNFEKTIKDIYNGNVEYADDIESKLGDKIKSGRRDDMYNLLYKQLTNAHDAINLKEFPELNGNQYERSEYDRIGGPNTNYMTPDAYEEMLDEKVQHMFDVVTVEYVYSGNHGGYYSYNIRGTNCKLKRFAGKDLSIDVTFAGTNGSSENNNWLMFGTISVMNGEDIDFKEQYQAAYNDDVVAKGIDAFVKYLNNLSNNIHDSKKKVKDSYDKFTNLLQSKIKDLIENPIVTCEYEANEDSINYKFSITGNFKNNLGKIDAGGNVWKYIPTQEWNANYEVLQDYGELNDEDCSDNMGYCERIIDEDALDYNSDGRNEDGCVSFGVNYIADGIKLAIQKLYNVFKNNK